jgi:hypothetical protein
MDMGTTETAASWWADPTVQQDRAAFADVVEARERARQASGAGTIPAHLHRLTRRQRAQAAQSKELI